MTLLYYSARDTSHDGALVLRDDLAERAEKVTDTKRNGEVVRRP